jgi:hypothetical protein
MPRIRKSNQERARAALAQLAAIGGADALPEVLKSADVKPLMSSGWFSDALRLDQMPGDQMCSGGVWRCDRQAFVNWLYTLAGTDRSAVIPAAVSLAPVANEDDHA